MGVVLFGVARCKQIGNEDKWDDENNKKKGGGRRNDRKRREKPQILDKDRERLELILRG